MEKTEHSGTWWIDGGKEGKGKSEISIDMLRERRPLGLSVGLGRATNYKEVSFVDKKGEGSRTLDRNRSGPPTPYLQ